MRAIFETTGRRQVDAHYVTAGVPGRIEENFQGFNLEHAHLSLEEVIQDQETVYQSLLVSIENDHRTQASASGSSNVNHGQSVEEKRDEEKERESSSSEVEDVESQLALDEALAISLQEVENQLLITSISESTGTESVNREVNSTNTSAQVVRQDNIDPDNMTYEELHSLGEAIGTENRGLSEELISYLPTSKYKTGGFFSKKDKQEECVICYMEYKNRDKLITLPCQHQYHSKCITRWLKQNKACPVCNEEVFGS